MVLTLQSFVYFVVNGLSVVGCGSGASKSRALEPRNTRNYTKRAKNRFLLMQEHGNHEGYENEREGYDGEEMSSLHSVRASVYFVARGLVHSTNLVTVAFVVLPKLTSSPSLMPVALR